MPSAVQEPGDLAFINGASSTTTPNDTNNGGAPGGTSNLNVVQAIHVKGNITNVAALRQSYGTCLIPIRLWSTTDDGITVTRLYEGHVIEGEVVEGPAEKQSPDEAADHDSDVGRGSPQG